jgi:hypothetical protein
MYGWIRRGHVCVYSTLFVLVLAASAAAQTPDTTPPTITATPTTEPNANGWYRTNVRVKFTCADLGGSRLASCPAAVVVSTDGEGQVVSGTARDRAGNTATASVTLNIDKTPPVVTASRSPEAPPSGWSTTPVIVSFSATDALSGIDPASVTAPITLATDRTNGSATGRATDLAGNRASFTLTGINIDQRAPRIKVTLTSTIGARGWRTSAVTAHFTCSDARSGIADCPADQVFTTDGPSQTVTGTTTDLAGHTASVSKTFNLDATPPVIRITAPDSPVTVDSATITGNASDATSGLLKLMIGDRRLVVAADGSFSHGPVPLVEGANPFTLVATDRAGNVREHVATITRIPAVPACTNMVVDPQFDIGESGFTAQDGSSIVARTEINPLEGASSLRVLITQYGNNIWWVRDFSGGRASNLAVSAHVRIDATTSSELQFCAMAYYQDGTTGLSCTAVSGTQMDHGTVSASLPLDPAKPLETVRIRMYQEGAEPLAFTLDAAFVCLDVVEEPDGGGDPGGGDPGGGGGGGGSGVCAAPNPNSVYQGLPYQLPTARPYLSLDHYLGADPNSAAYIQFQAGVDDALAGGPPYAYSASHSVIMYRLTGNVAYLEDAIARVDQFVIHGEAAIAAGGQPALAGDSYLEVGWFIEQLSLAYDFGFELLTPSQQQRWTRFGDQAIHNVWHPADATWDSRPHPWTGWSVCDPGNNYHYSFLRATMMWGWARQDLTLLNFLQTQKFPPLMDYLAALPGGGSREGTGYGTAQKNLFENYVYWKSATGEDLATITPHTKQTIDYWVHATVPTLDRFAPIGDQSRSSIPELYDYHENLVHTAVALSPGTPEAGRGAWWVQHNSVNGPIHQFNAAPYLLSYADAPAAPTALSYHASGAGVFFARSHWATDASWVSFVAGKYDQSHAHQDQGSFTFFTNDWLAVTNNIWSHSGINQGVEVHNVIRFERPDGTVIPQNHSDTVQSTLVETSAGGTQAASANLSNAYSANSSLVQSWTRDIQLTGDRLRVTDQCTVAAGVVPVFQINVPVEPVRQENGEFFAGHLRITPLQPVSAWNFVQMAAPEFNGGWRIDLYAESGCAFSFELRGQF